jgi:hypothetical protein
VGYVLMRFKRHRWYPKILKTHDPVILSVGWRRFETIPLYAHQDDNLRNRMLKYTPEHMHCMASFYGPLAPPGTGVLAVSTVAEASAQFRISGTGVVVELDKNSDVVKKLKLIGVPMKVGGGGGSVWCMFYHVCPSFIKSFDLSPKKDQQQDGVCAGHVHVVAGSGQVRGRRHPHSQRHPRPDQKGHQGARGRFPRHL